MARTLGSGSGRLRGHGEACGRRHVPPRHAPVPVGRPPARGARPHLLPDRRSPPFPPADRGDRVLPDGMGRFRPSRGELRDPEGDPPAHLHAREHRGHEGAVSLVGRSLRLDEGSHDLRARVLPLEPVVLPQAPREGPRRPEEIGGQLVPVVPHGPRERAGRRGSLRTLQDAGGPARAGTVVPEDHRLRRTAAGRPRHPRQVAREGRHDAAQLDRQVHGRRSRFRDSVARGNGARLHDASGHRLRRDGAHPRPRARARPAPPRGEPEEGRASGMGRVRAQPGADRARSRGRREGRPRHRPQGDQPLHGRGRADMARELRHRGLRHGRAHGGARSRHPRLRLREEVRDPDRQGDRRREERFASEGRRREERGFS